MKKLIVVFALSAVMQMHDTTSMMQMFDEMDQHMLHMHEQMERVFSHMSEQTHVTKIEAPEYALSFQEKDDTVLIELSLPKNITSSDVSVEMEDGALDVLVQAEGERIELKVSGNYVTMSSSKIVRQESKDNKGTVRTFSSGSSHMAQTLPLPAKIDLQRRAPQADLTDGLLTLTLAKKGAHKIPVTTAASATAPANKVAVQAPQEEIVDFEK